MTYLIDTDYVADYLKGREHAVTLLQQLVLAGARISIITYAETYEGIFYGHNRAKHETGLRHFVSTTPILPITRPIAQRFAVIRGGLRAKGLLIPDPDLFIAATALHHDLTLVTRNLKDYRRIANLRIYNIA